jgi:hypothetical protein
MGSGNRHPAELDFLVRRDNLRTSEVVAAVMPATVPVGQVLMRVDEFAFTSNNVTYAAFGESMAYWSFFPAPEGWGRIPVWGFGTVLASAVDAIKPGERFYGYFPMSGWVIVQPERTSEAGFFDGASHRKPLHAVYNQYLRTSTDPGYDPAREAEQMLLRPLFVTSFLIDDFLADNAFFGAQSVVLSSASSKTAYGTAFQLAQRGARGQRPEIGGLTSASNAPFVLRLGCYDRVVTYDQVESLPRETPTVYVDMAGDGAVRKAIHQHFQEHLKHSCSVGGTHWDALSGAGGLPGPRPTLFFAPAQIKKRAGDWGPAELQKRIAVAWKAFLGAVASPSQEWMKVVRGKGAAEVERVYLAMLDGRAKPDEGHILSL